MSRPCYNLVFDLATLNNGKVNTLGWAMCPWAFCFLFYTGKSLCYNIGSGKGRFYKFPGDSIRVKVYVTTPVPEKGDSIWGKACVTKPIAGEEGSIGETSLCYKNGCGGFYMRNSLCYNNGCGGGRFYTGEIYVTTSVPGDSGGKSVLQHQFRERGLYIRESLCYTTGSGGVDSARGKSTL